MSLLFLASIVFLIIGIGLLFIAYEVDQHDPYGHDALTGPQAIIFIIGVVDITFDALLWLATLVHFLAEHFA